MSLVLQSTYWLNVGRTVERFVWLKSPVIATNAEGLRFSRSAVAELTTSYAYVGVRGDVNNDDNGEGKLSR